MIFKEYFKNSIQDSPLWPKKDFDYFGPSKNYLQSPLLSKEVQFFGQGGIFCQIKMNNI